MRKIFCHLLTSKVNPKWIIKNHLETFVDGKGRRHRQDYITFFILPVIPAVICKLFGAALDADIVDIINTGLALFAGLFLSVSIQLIAIDRSKLTSDSAKNIQKQTISNISFLILLSLVAILLSYFSLFQGFESKYLSIDRNAYKAVVDTLVYWLIGVFMLTVLMILKRVSILFEKINS